MITTVEIPFSQMEGLMAELNSGTLDWVTPTGSRVYAEGDVNNTSDWDFIVWGKSGEGTRELLFLLLAYGGFSGGRPTSVAGLGEELVYDNEGSVTAWPTSPNGIVYAEAYNDQPFPTAVPALPRINFIVLSTDSEAFSWFVATEAMLGAKPKDREKIVAAKTFRVLYFRGAREAAMASLFHIGDHHKAALDARDMVRRQIQAHRGEVPVPVATIAAANTTEVTK